MTTAGATRTSSRSEGKRPVDPWRPNGWLWEEERRGDGALTAVLTVFLAGAECPFRCVFCDLWRQTLDGPTPPGAIPTQIEHALHSAGPVPAGAAVKLYNASNFFDPRAVPPADDVAVARHLAPFARVIVESHPQLIDRRCREFAGRLRGTLEVAIGLETARPDVLARLAKAMTLDDFDRAAATLRNAGAGLRVFLLLPPPYVPPGEAAGVIARSVVYARDRGASHVSLIPTRGGEVETFRRAGDFTPPDLDLVEEVLDRCRETAGTVVTVDLWDIDRLVACRHCGPARVARLRNINLTGRAAPRVSCSRCDSPS